MKARSCTAAVGLRRGRALIAALRVPYLCRGVWAVIAAAAVLLAPERSEAQSPLKLQLAYPRYPGKNNVHWWRFDWVVTELRPVPGGAPVRLYYSQDEEDVARLAIPSIEAAYDGVARRLAYVPSRPIPLQLYSSHFEYESTTAFFITESVLGVTSPVDLSVSLPFWGEMSRFRHVVGHELAHELILQKLADAGKATDCNPHSRIPRWFLEGLAEAASLPRLTPEAESALVDAFVTQAGAREAETLPPFFAEGPKSYERIYLLGHAQVRFIEEHFGSGTVDRLLAATPGICKLGHAPLLHLGTANPFAALMSQTLKVPVAEIEGAWRDWARARVGPALQAANPLDSLRLIVDLGKGEVDSFVLSPDGTVVLYRIFDVESSTARLYLRHLPSGKSREIAHDRSVALVSLHALDRRVVALGPNVLVYIGRVGATDRIFVQRYRWTGDDFDVQDRLEHDVAAYPDLVEAGSPTIDPTTGAVVFVALDRTRGTLDIYRLPQPFEPKSALERVTNDAYAEQGLSYGGGELWLVSDATPTARFQLAHIIGGRSVIVSDFGDASEALNPSAAGELGVLFQSGATGLYQAYLYDGASIRRVTDVATGLTMPALSAADGALYGIVPIDGKRRLAALPRGQWLDAPVPAVATGGAAAPWTPVLAPAPESESYHATSVHDWRVANFIAVASAGPSALANVQLRDRLDTNQLGVSFRYLGSQEQLDLTLSYLRLSGRLNEGLRLLLDSGEQQQVGFEYTLRRFGADGLLSYPIDRFASVDGYLGLVGLQATGFEEDAGAFAERNEGTHLCGEAGIAIELDTLRIADIGPFKGTAATLAINGTVPFGKVKSYGNVTLDVQQYIPVFRRYDRLFVRARAAGGLSIQTDLTEQFYVPAGANLREYHEDSRRIVGNNFVVLQAEANFPLAPRVAEFFLLQGIVGADAGAVTLQIKDLWDQRTGAAIGGLQVVAAPFIIRGLLAVPIDLGAGRPQKNVLFQLTVAAPLLGYY